MSAEPVAAPVETTTSTQAPRERAPRIDFDSMSIEELKAFLEQPLEKVPMPNKKAMEEECEKIDAEIKKRKERFDEIKAEKDIIRSGYTLRSVGYKYKVLIDRLLTRRRLKLERLCMPAIRSSLLRDAFMSTR